MRSLTPKEALHKADLMPPFRVKGAVRYLSKGLRERIRGMLDKLYADGWHDADFMARQIVDDLVREGIPTMQFRQHLVEQMAQALLDSKRVGWTGH